MKSVKKCTHYKNQSDFFVKAIFGIGQTENWITLMWTKKITTQNQYVQIENEFPIPKLELKQK